MPLCHLTQLQKTQRKILRNIYIIDTEYWINMFDGKEDISETIRRYINNSNKHPLKILIPQPVIGEFVVKSIKEKKMERVDHFITFLFEQNKILDFPILDHKARFIASSLNNNRLYPNDLHIVSIGIFYAKTIRILQ